MSRQADTTKQLDATVLEYLKAATTSSDRARTVLIVMITASVLVFTVIWNSGGWKKDNRGWFDSRINARQAAAKLYDSPLLNPEAPSLSAEQKRAFAYMKEAGLDWSDERNKEKLQEEVKDMLKIRTEQFRIIRVPFFGVVFDMNDLGMFAGITFTVVLLWLTFSVARERRNLKLTFAEADERGQIKPSYELLMMHQVLTVPPTRGHRFGRVSNAVPKLLYFVPAAVYALQLKTDWDSRHIGNILSPDNMMVILIAEYVFITLMLIFTALCFSLSLSTDRIWQGAFREAYPPEMPEEASPEPSNAQGNDVLNKPKDEQKESGEQRVTAELNRRYIIAALFACVFIASTTILLGGVSGILHTTSDTSIWVAVFTAVISAIGTISTTILAWRKDRRDGREVGLKIEQLEQELEEARKRPVFPVSGEKPK